MTDNKKEKPSDDKKEQEQEQNSRSGSESATSDSEYGSVTGQEDLDQAPQFDPNQNLNFHEEITPSRDEMLTPTRNGHAQVTPTNSPKNQATKENPDDTKKRMPPKEFCQKALNGDFNIKDYDMEAVKGAQKSREELDSYIERRKKAEERMKKIDEKSAEDKKAEEEEIRLCKEREKEARKKFNQTLPEVRKLENAVTTGLYEKKIHELWTELEILEMEKTDKMIMITNDNTYPPETQKVTPDEFSEWVFGASSKSKAYRNKQNKDPATIYHSIAVMVMDMQKNIAKLARNQNTMANSHNERIEEENKPPLRPQSTPQLDPKEWPSTQELKRIDMRIDKRAEETVNKTLAKISKVGERETKKKEDLIRNRTRIRASRIPELEDDTSNLEPTQVAKREIDNFCNFVNKSLFNNMKPTNESLKYFVQPTDIYRMSRQNWPEGSDGVKEKWARTLKIQLKDEKVDIADNLILDNLKLCTTTNRDIRNGTKKEEDKVHLHLKREPTEAQARETTRLRVQVAQENANRRMANPKNKQIQLVWFTLKGDPYIVDIQDRHPERTKITEEKVWNLYKPGGSRYKIPDPHQKENTTEKRTNSRGNYPRKTTFSKTEYGHMAKALEEANRNPSGTFQTKWQSIASHGTKGHRKQAFSPNLPGINEQEKPKRNPPGAGVGEGLMKFL